LVSPFRRYPAGTSAAAALLGLPLGPAAAFDDMMAFAARRSSVWQPDAVPILKGEQHPPLLLQQSPRSRTRFSHACFAGRVMSGLRRFAPRPRTAARCSPTATPR